MLELITYEKQLGIPILSIIIFIPILCGLFIMFFSDKDDIDSIRNTALIGTSLDFVATLLLIGTYKTGSDAMQFVEKCDWIPAIGASYFLGIDGISLFLILLTTFLGPIIILSTYSHIKVRVKEFMVCILVLQGAMLGVFLALDLLLFYFFWEVMLLPMFLIIGIWGGKRKLYSGIKFFLYTLVGSVPMVLGILGIYFNYHNWAIANHLTETYTFDLIKLYSVPIDPSLQSWIFWALFLGFAIKVPMFPFHTWLPDAHTDAPTAGSVILAGILLKMGTYGFVRFSLPLLPQGVDQNLTIMLFISGVAIVYGSWVAMNQADMKKLVAYSSVAHMAYIMLGTFSLNNNGITGGVIQNINHGLSTGALFLLVGIIYDRRHTRMIKEFGGLFKQLPLYTTFFVIIMLSSMGIPGLNGFVGEVLILMGAWEMSRVACIVGFCGILSGAGYLLWMFQRVFLGEITNPENKKLKDMDSREVTTLVPIVVVCLVIGLYPVPFINNIQPSVKKVLQIMNMEKPKMLVIEKKKDVVLSDKIVESDQKNIDG